MTKKDKLIDRFLGMPNDFHFNEIVKLLGYFDFHPVKKGKTNKRVIEIMKYLEYKGYTGSIEYSSEDNILYGQVLGIRGLISYEGITGKELESDFKDAINTYIDDCKAEGITPEQPFKGSFNVRISSTLHRKAALLARESKTSLNNFVAESIRSRIANET